MNDFGGLLVVLRQIRGRLGMLLCLHTRRITAAIAKALVRLGKVLDLRSFSQRSRFEHTDADSGSLTQRARRALLDDSLDVAATEDEAGRMEQQPRWICSSRTIERLPLLAWSKAMPRLEPPPAAALKNQAAPTWESNILPIAMSRA